MSGNEGRQSVLEDIIWTCNDMNGDEFESRATSEKPQQMLSLAVLYHQWSDWCRRLRRIFRSREWATHAWYRSDPTWTWNQLCGSVVWNLCHGSIDYVSLNLCWSVHTVLCQHDSLNWLGCIDFECTIMTNHACDVMYVGFFSFGLALFPATCSWVFKVLFANSLSQVFEHSIEAGFPLLVENMPEHIDAVLQPVTLQGVRWYRMVHIGWDPWFGFSHAEILRGDTEPLKELKHDAAPHEWGRIM